MRVTPGFLTGGEAPLRGRFDSAAADSLEVQILVNDRPIATTVAATVEDGSLTRSFSVNCAELLRYVGDGDVVRIECNGDPIALGDGSKYSSISLNCGHSSEVDLLFKKLDEGFVFCKNGCLRPRHDAASKRRQLDIFTRVERLVSNSTGQPVYPFYGNLLGAIRDSEFIHYDVGGFDALYLCESTEPDKVKREIMHLCDLLRRLGFSPQGQFDVDNDSGLWRR